MEQSTMPAIEANVRLSTSKLFEAVEKLSLSELDQLLSRIIALRARQKSPHLSDKESELLTQINKGLPPDVRTRLDQLVKKRRANNLTSDEYNELLALTDVLEQAEVERAEALVQLARLRGVSMTELMQDLGIQAPDYA